jgi:serine/threonine-protein kinase
MLRLTTFGGLAIRGEGTEVGSAADPAVSRRALALLVLVAAHGTGLSREKALALLWSESDEERARNALRQSLHTLRRELRAPDYLLAGDPLRLNPAVITSDLREFEEARSAGRREEAVSRYAGPFLDGFHVGAAPEFERWVEETRAVLAREVAELLEGLAREAGRRAEPAAAAGWWRRLASLEPLNSAVALALMESLAAAGDRAGALRHAQVHEALLREELGTAPDPAVAALADRLRSAGPAAVPPPRPAPVAASAPPGRAGPADFLGRLRADLDGRYAIGDEIERGRDGAVRLLRARDLRHERDVVLKVIHPALASVIDVDRFLREIKLTARLRHPHILPLLDSGEVGGRPWYAAPATGGESLRQRLARDVRLPPEESIGLIRELADALDHAHRHEVIHRDVSPENIVLAEGHAVLTNLGVARALDAAAGPKLTETGMLVGSPAYMSPEQAAGAGQLDGRSDQYALACVLFEMLAGEPLFSGPTPQAIMAKRAVHHFRSPAHLEIRPPEVSAALARALAADPGQRFPSMGAFAAAAAGGPAERAPTRRPWLDWLGRG